MTGMENYHEYKPKAALCRYVECIWILNGKNDETNSIVESLVPGGRTELIFTKSELIWHGSNRRNEAERISSSFLLGQRNRVKYITCLNQYSSLGVRLRYGCLPVFMGVHASSCSNRITLLNKIFGTEIAHITASLFEAQNKDDAIQTIESWLERNIIEPNNDWRHLQEYLGKLTSIENAGLMTTKMLSKEYGWNDKKAERVFLKYVGFTPAQFIKIIRFRRSVEKLFADYENLTDLAYDSGFYDQSHFIREFYRYAGNKPSDFLKRPNSIAKMLYKTR
ncbi:MAG: helix-turn-helix domain-containing protein [Niastella sp.]|uniref:helix-turn-helix domain-containing protein n=1 Tax=Niastella sp. TaxID=1869183 RepID=UPI00389A3552